MKGAHEHMKQVSIIMPVFNVEKYLREAVDSVRRQTFPHWELLMIDDGSTDQSGSICDDYVQMDDRIRVFHTANGGVSRARNLGIEHARGEYITFLDSDDYLREDFLETMLKHAEGVELVICSARLVPEGTIRALADEVTYYSSLQDTLRDIDRLLTSYFYSAVWNKLYIREKVTIRFDPNLSLGEDFCFNAEYFKKCNGIRVLPDALNNYRLSSENSLTKVFRPDLIEELKVWFHTQLYLLGDTPENKRHLCNCIISKVMNQCTLLARSNNYSLHEKKAVLDHWASSDFWKDEALDFKATGNKRHELFLKLLKDRKVWTALTICEFVTMFLDWKKQHEER